MRFIKAQLKALLYLGIFSFGVIVGYSSKGADQECHHAATAGSVRQH